MTTENNKIIAEFMSIAIIDSNGNHKEEYKYHSDWNWLMEVVEKITKTNEFQEYEFNSLFWEIFCKIEINEVYIQVVIFIKWYKENK